MKQRPCWRLSRLVVCALWLVMAPWHSAAELYLIDSHSQIDQYIAIEEIIPLMDEAGVFRTILAARDRRAPEDVIALARRYPARITPAVRIKGQKVAAIEKQTEQGTYGAMAEVLMWHREKTRHVVTRKDGTIVAPPRVVMPPDDPTVAKLLALTRKKGWPFIAHIEFASAGADREPFMEKFEDLLRRHPDHPFVLIHMGMLGFEDVRRLIETHPNIHFIPAHSDPFSVKKSDNPFTKMFKGGLLAPAWKALVNRHSDRFILGFDMVWSREWQRHYVKEVGLWRKALNDLPDLVARAVAHGNAERLWRLPPPAR